MGAFVQLLFQRVELFLAVVAGSLSEIGVLFTLVAGVFALVGDFLALVGGGFAEVGYTVPFIGGPFPAGDRILASLDQIFALNELGLELHLVPLGFRQAVVGLVVLSGRHTPRVAP